MPKFNVVDVISVFGADALKVIDVVTGRRFVCANWGHIGEEDSILELVMSSNSCTKCDGEYVDHYSFGLGEIIKKCQKCGWMP